MIEVPTVDKILEFGQGDDDVVFELFQGIHYMMAGYYALFNYGDEWWEAMNQDNWMNDIIKEAWSKVDWEEVETAIEIAYKVMCGSYIKEGDFYNALEKISLKGLGFRPQRKKVQVEETK